MGWTTSVGDSGSSELCLVRQSSYSCIVTLNLNPMINHCIQKNGSEQNSVIKNYFLEFFKIQTSQT